MATTAALLASVLVGQPNNVLLVYMDDLRTNVDGTEVSDPSATLHLLLPCCVHVQILFSRRRKAEQEKLTSRAWVAIQLRGRCCIALHTTIIINTPVSAMALFFQKDALGRARMRGSGCAAHPAQRPCFARGGTLGGERLRVRA